MSEASVERCRRYRRRILEISRQVEAAHVAPAFSCIEIVDMLYHDVMREQDIFIMSKGHGCLAQYVVLEDLGKLPDGELDRYCRPDGAFGAHPDYRPAFGIHASTGSLGHGLGIAAGQALGERLKDSGAHVYVLVSDGECQEGSTWEATMVAANLGLSNLTCLVDFNGWGGMERTDRMGPFPALLPLAEKFRAFGWNALSFSGHERLKELAAWVQPSKHLRRPRAAVCRTAKGKGVSFIENGQPLWHYRSPSEKEYLRALEEIG